jgi:amino acid transporter
MPSEHDQAATITEDVRQLQQLGYAQELSRRMSGLSNVAISLSIICILAGGITSFHLGFCSVGGAAIGLGWPIVCVFSLIVAAAMAHVASAFPTAGGLYHWATILGGRGWGWATAWFNLAGLVTVLAAINVGTYQFLAGSFAPHVATDVTTQLGIVALITFSQALLNHLGIRVTTLLTDAQRPLISNIHSRGISWSCAALRIAALIEQMRAQRASGIAIKEHLPQSVLVESTPPDAALIKGAG